MPRPELLDVERSVVVVIDLQGKLVEMAFRHERVIAATNRLIRLAITRVMIIKCEAEAK